MARQRKKTPEQIEAQSRRLSTQSIQRYGYQGDFANNRISRLSKATENVRNQNGYSNTGQRTRSLDTIFQDRDGKRFTVQMNGNGEYRKVGYRGAKASASMGLANANG